MRKNANRGGRKSDLKAQTEHEIFLRDCRDSEKK